MTRSQERRQQIIVWLGDHVGGDPSQALIHATTTGNFTGPPTQVWTTTSLPGIHTAKVGLNYKFDMLGYVLGIVR